MGQSKTIGGTINPKQWIPIALILLGGFSIDLLTPRGFADWALYILPLLLTMRTASRCALRANPALQAVPIVAVTSYAIVGDREKVMAAGCNGYLEKPINPETFVSDIESFLHTPGKAGAP